MKPQSFKEANYKYIRFDGDKTHILMDKDTGHIERWVSRNSPHAGFCLKYKNTYLEFCGGIDIVK